MLPACKDRTGPGRCAPGLVAEVAQYFDLLARARVITWR
jgi:hypothetical protein